MKDLRKSKRPADWPKTGWYWFLHHDTIVEWTDDIDERWDYVCRNKPLNELPTRLKWMRHVVGELPEELTKVWADCDKALADCMPEIIALMRTELPGVPWDGEVLAMEADDERTE